MPILQILPEAPANMIGCNRLRVNVLTNRFRKLGYTEDEHRIRVHKSLLNILVRDLQPHILPFRSETSATYSRFKL